MAQTMETYLGHLTEICLAYLTATSKATSLVCLLDYWMVIKMAQMRERHSVQLTEIDWVQLTEIQLEVLKELSSAYSWAEQMALKTESC